MKNIIPLLLLSLTLSACLTNGKRGGDVPMAVYDLGIPAARSSASEGGPFPALAVDVHAPHWFDSLAVEYRLAYADPSRLRGYAHARWAAPAAGLIQQRLVQRLGYVLVGQAGAKCLLRLDIDEFSQIFDSPGQSRGVLQARLTLFDHRRNRLTEKPVAIESPALTADSKGGVAALTQTVDQLADQLKTLQDQWRRAGKLKACE